MSVDIEIFYQGNLKCSSRHGPSGHSIITDAPVDNGGKGEAFSPTDLVATALGTCMVTVMGLAARTLGLDLTGLRVHVVKEMTAVPVRRIGTLMVVIIIPNAGNLSPADRAKLERAAAACPVKQSLHPDVAVTTEFVYHD